MDDDRLLRDVPLLGLELSCGDTRLRAVRERDLPALADLQSDDVELDPTVERWPGHDDDSHRRRTVDSWSWLTASARGRGTGVRMRQAVLGLVFDHLGAAPRAVSRSNSPTCG